MHVRLNHSGSYSTGFLQYPRCPFDSLGPSARSGTMIGRPNSALTRLCPHLSSLPRCCSHTLSIFKLLSTILMSSNILSVEADARDTLAWLANVHMLRKRASRENHKQDEGGSPTFVVKTDSRNYPVRGTQSPEQDDYRSPRTLGRKPCKNIQDIYNCSLRRLWFWHCDNLCTDFLLCSCVK